MYRIIHELNIRVYKFSWVPHANILAQNFLVRHTIYCACIKLLINSLPCTKGAAKTCVILEHPHKNLFQLIMPCMNFPCMTMATMDIVSIIYGTTYA